MKLPKCAGLSSLNGGYHYPLHKSLSTGQLDRFRYCSQWMVDLFIQPFDNWAIDRFAHKVAILISIVSKDIMGCSGADEYVFAPRASIIGI